MIKYDILYIHWFYILIGCESWVNDCLSMVDTWSVTITSAQVILGDTALQWKQYWGFRDYISSPFPSGDFVLSLACTIGEEISGAYED